MAEGSCSPLAWSANRSDGFLVSCCEFKPGSVEISATDERVFQRTKVTATSLQTRHAARFYDPPGDFGDIARRHPSLPPQIVRRLVLNERRGDNGVESGGADGAAEQIEALVHVTVSAVSGEAYTWASQALEAEESLEGAHNLEIVSELVQRCAGLKSPRVDAGRRLLELDRQLAGETDYKRLLEMVEKCSAAGITHSKRLDAARDRLASVTALESLLGDDQQPISELSDVRRLLCSAAPITGSEMVDKGRRIDELARECLHVKDVDGLASACEALESLGARNLPETRAARGLLDLEASLAEEGCWSSADALESAVKKVVS